MLVSVNICVTITATLPGIADKGMKKLKNDIMTTALHGK